MENFIQLLNSYGFSFDESTPDIVLLAGYYLVLSVFILLNFLNIFIYLFSIYIVTHEKFLNLIPKKYAFILKWIHFYKGIRISFIIFEVLLTLFLLGIMILMSYGLVSYYMQLK